MSTCPSRLSRKTVSKLAHKIAHELAPGCRRIQIAGSVRRRALTSGDIEIVAIPLRQPGLFPGQKADSLLNPILDQLLANGRLKPGRCNGQKLKAFTIPVANHFPLELYLVTPQTWAVQLALRTGPADFSRSLVTTRSRGGRLADGHHVQDARLLRDPDDWRADQPTPISTPEESDFLAFAGGWVEPHDRRVSQPVRDPQQATPRAINAPEPTP